MNYPAAELRSIKMNFYLLNPDAEHRGILLIKWSRLEAAPTTNTTCSFQIIGLANFNAMVISQKPCLPAIVQFFKGTTAGALNLEP